MPAILFFVIVGAAAGFLATRLMRIQTDVLTTIVLGMAGAVISWLALRILLAVTGWMLWAVGALLGAVLVIWLWQTYGPKG
jgi:uncharacterized membrane protein YeaQ/YmgE (transglycosylase-associated protein family)